MWGNGRSARMTQARVRRLDTEAHWAYTYSVARPMVAAI